MAISTVERFLKFFPTIIDNVAEKFSPPEELVELLNDLGWDFPIDEAPDFEALVDTVNNLIDAVFNLEDANGTVEYLRAISDLANELNNTISTISDIQAFFESIGNAWQALPAYIEEFPQQLIDYLIIDYLENYYPGVFTFLRIAHIIEIDKYYTPKLDNGDNDPNRIPYDRKTLHLNELGNLIANPSNFLTRIYQWGTDQFDSQRFLNKLEEICIDLNLPAGQYNANPTIATNLLGIENPTFAQIGKELHIPIYEVPDEDIGYVDAGVNIYPIPGNDSLLPGFCLIPYFNGGTELKLDFGTGLQMELEGDITSGIGIVVRPGNIQTKNNLLTAQPVNYAAKLKAKFSQKPPHELKLIFGTPDETRLGFKNISQSIFIEVNSNNQNNLSFELNLEGGEFVFDPSQGDSFISEIFSDLKVETFFDIILGWSNSDGIYFKGSGDLSIYLPTHFTIGPLELIGTNIKILSDNGKLPVTLGTNVKGNLGPLFFSLEDFGLSFNFKFPDNSNGNLGPVDLNMRFKPPYGVLLSLNIEKTVKGGGFIRYWPDRFEYNGIFELTIFELVSVKAIGIINTRLPDGSEGYSVLIMLTAEFGSGVQLGLGFTLLAVGGLVGIHRTMLLEKIGRGVRDNSINSVMFPQNVFDNAPRIINDLNTFFPAQKDEHLIGPMAKIGWGTPQKIEISLGVIVQFSGDIGILGIIKIALPDKNKPAILLQVNFLGALEVSKKRIWFFASLFDSNVLGVTLAGEFGLLIAWGNNSNFLTSAGGFHPAFDVPALPFPVPKRISVTFINEPGLKLRAMGYFAVTSNTAQFGARAEFFAGVDEFKAEGHIAFDALFQFSPFYFIISISSSLGVKVFGIGLFTVRVSLSLEGPTPWRARGTGYISVLLFEFDVDFDVTFGSNRKVTLEPIAIKQKLIDELSKDENWQTESPKGNKNLVTLRKLGPEESERFLHPVGDIRISQQLLPLGKTLDFIGYQPLADYKKFTIGINNATIAYEKFAMGQFLKKRDSENLSQDAYEDQQGGVIYTPAAGSYKTGKATKRTVRYEKEIIDILYRRAPKVRAKGVDVFHRRHLLGNAAGISVLGKANKPELINPDTVVSLKRNATVIVNSDDNTRFSDQNNSNFQTTFASESLATEYLTEAVAKDPGLENKLQIIPENELVV